jgi:hypothetical protein
VTQDLAGAPEPLNRYQHASPAATAVLEAPLDARRLGVRLHLPQAFLTDAATDCLSQIDYDQLTDDWAEQAYAELAKPVHGKQAPLRRTTHPHHCRRNCGPTVCRATFRLADYLEQHDRATRRHLCPPCSFWHTAHTHLTHLDDLNNLSWAAGERHRLQWAHHLSHRAADHGNIKALYSLATDREEAGDREGAQALALQVADHGSAYPLHRMNELRELFDRLWPNGPDPDGMPTPPWRPSASALRGQHVPPDAS